jgi:uncharacterized membrane protein
MEPKRSKYDTNPLDEDVAHRADESFGREQSDASTEDIGGVTHPINRSAPETSRGPNQNEAPTRRIDDKATSYPSVFVPPPRRPSATYAPPRVNSADIYQPPPVPPLNVYQGGPMPVMGRFGFQRVEGLGIQERWAVLIPYLPFWPLGIIGAIVELFVVPRTESRTRFHASQALVLQLVITALSMLLVFIGFISGGHFSGVGLFRFASFVFLIIAMIRVFKGKPLVIPPLDGLRRWLDEKIKPRK